MAWSIAADLVLVAHFAFVAFIVAGGLLTRWLRWLTTPQLTSLAYGAAIQAIGFTCPLTPLEKSLRQAAGESVYDGGFIGHYLAGVLYPGELSTATKLWLSLAVGAVNIAAYTWSIRTTEGSRSGRYPPSNKG